jgi:catechol 2,3-dioxygenase
MFAGWTRAARLEIIVRLEKLWRTRMNNQSEQPVRGQIMSNHSISPTTQIGPVSLTVADLERSSRFYQDVLGLKLLQQKSHTAMFGVDIPLLLLTEQPGASPRPLESPGLYHFAILVPGRVDLASALRHLLDVGYPILAILDHGVSEALYLADPDGNGIEIYRDCPRSAWPWHNGRLGATSDPLDRESLLSELDGSEHAWNGLPPHTHVGHVNLLVADFAQMAAFYRDVLGFEEAITGVPGALFLAAGGYHHHVALSSWHSQAESRPTTETAGLRFFTIYVPDMAEVERLAYHLEVAGIHLMRQGNSLMLRDPEGNGVLLRVGLPQNNDEVMSSAEAFPDVRATA